MAGPATVGTLTGRPGAAMRTTMRRSVLILGALASAACVVDSHQARPMEPNPPAPDRSREALGEIERQQRWMGEALAGRPAADELQAVREGDADAVSDTRKRFRRLLTAVERATWIRETVPEGLRGSANPGRLGAAVGAAGPGREDPPAAAGGTGPAPGATRFRPPNSLG